ncbi:MAG TPA: AzlD domain-containing protein [Burkholderiaceae bacterium]|jgi:branched-subunit amino acid transport protein|nr:AzlD domain-containing protein [Burkholderiaceae bacterium]
MSGLTLAAAIAGLTLVTLATRSLFLLLGHRVTLPERIRHGLRYAPACALAALVLPQLVLADQRLNLSLLNPRLDAGLIAVAVMVSTRSMLGAMSAGMAAFLLLRALL